MWIEMSNVLARLVRATDDERRWVNEYLSFGDKEAHWKGLKDGKLRAMNPITEQFAAGFVALIQKAAPADGFDVQVIDKRVPSAPIDQSADLAWLRDYQREAVQKVLARTRGIVWAPTGAGKGEIAVGFTVSVPDIKWLFLVHRTNLVRDIADRYARRTGMRAGIVAEGEWSAGDGNLVCASFSTLTSALKRDPERAIALLKSVGGIIVDEVHVLPSDSYQRVTNATVNAYYRVGLSGTPLARGDQKSVLAIGSIGPVVYRIKTELLVGEGVLAKPRIVMVESKQPVRTKSRSWNDVYSAMVEKSESRNALLIEAARRAEKPALLFVKGVDHGKLLHRMLAQSGLRSEFVWGSHSTDWRAARVRDLVSDRLDVLVCSVVFQEGLDAPAIRSVIVGSGGQSVIAALQRIGRGMRRADGKSTFEVYDIEDKDCGCVAATTEFGTPGLGVHKPCEWLARHARKRKKSYLGEGHQVIAERWPAPRLGRARNAPATQDGAEPGEPPKSAL